MEFYDAKHYLSDCDHWGKGGLILHELSHAWHNIHIENGYDNKQIKEFYELAMKDGLYDCVRVHGPQGPECKAYACTNAMEYFAELSVAFLGGLDDALEHNKWFPFNRTQLREHVQEQLICCVKCGVLRSLKKMLIMIMRLKVGSEPGIEEK